MVNATVRIVRLAWNNVDLGGSTLLSFERPAVQSSGWRASLLVGAELTRTLKTP
jgi:hypothetical protein